MHGKGTIIVGETFFPTACNEQLFHNMQITA